MFDPSGRSIAGFSQNIADNAVDMAKGLGSLAAVAARDTHEAVLPGEQYAGGYQTDDVVKALPGAIVDDYKTRYGGLMRGDFDQLYEKPLDFGLDALGVYAAAKGAGVAGKALDKAGLAVLKNKGVVPPSYLDEFGETTRSTSSKWAPGDQLEVGLSRGLHGRGGTKAWRTVEAVEDVTDPAELSAYFGALPQAPVVRIRFDDGSEALRLKSSAAPHRPRAGEGGPHRPRAGEGGPHLLPTLGRVMGARLPGLTHLSGVDPSLAATLAAGMTSVPGGLGALASRVVIPTVGKMKGFELLPEDIHKGNTLDPQVEATGILPEGRGKLPAGMWMGDDARWPRGFVYKKAVDAAAYDRGDIDSPEWLNMYYAHQGIAPEGAGGFRKGVVENIDTKELLGSTMGQSLSTHGSDMFRDFRKKGWDTDKLQAALDSWIGSVDTRGLDKAAKIILEPENQAFYDGVQKVVEGFGFKDGDLVPVIYGGRDTDFGTNRIVRHGAIADPNTARSFANGDIPSGSVPEMSLFWVPKQHIIGLASGSEMEILYLAPRNLKEMYAARRDPDNNKVLKKFFDMRKKYLASRQTDQWGTYDFPQDAKDEFVTGMHKLSGGRSLDDVQGEWDVQPDWNQSYPRNWEEVGYQVPYQTDTWTNQGMEPPAPLPEYETDLTNHFDSMNTANTYEPLIDDPSWYDEPVPPQILSENDVPSGLEYQGPANIGGEGEKHFVQDAMGETWLFKPSFQHGTQNPAPYKAYANELASKLEERVHGPYSSIKAIPMYGPIGNGQGTFGTLVQFKETLQPLRARLQAGEPLSITEKEWIQREQVVDWLISQHDTAADNILFDPDSGQLFGIDKEQAFRYFGQDQLDWNYVAPHIYPDNPPIYKILYDKVMSGEEAPLSWEPVEQALQAIENLPDQAYMQMLEKYAGERQWTQEEWALALQRKQNIRQDFERLYSEPGVRGQDVPDPNAPVHADPEFAAYMQSHPNSVVSYETWQMLKGQGMI